MTKREAIKAEIMNLQDYKAELFEDIRKIDVEIEKLKEKLILVPCLTTRPK